jgi:copper chaperone
MTESLTLSVTGMKCGGCENTLKTKLEMLEGISAVVAKHTEKTVEVTFEPEKIDEEGIVDAIISAGFDVE